MKYVLKQQLRSGEIWTSTVTFEARELHHVAQAVIGGYIHGEPRWAEDETGRVLYRLNEKGVQA